MLHLVSYGMASRLAFRVAILVAIWVGGGEGRMGRVGVGMGGAPSEPREARHGEPLHSALFMVFIIAKPTNGIKSARDANTVTVCAPSYT